MPHTGLGDGIFGLTPPHFFPDPISGTLILWDAVCEFMLCLCVYPEVKCNCVVREHFCSRGSLTRVGL